MSSIESMKQKLVNKDQIQRAGFIRIFGLGAGGSVINNRLIPGLNDLIIDDNTQDDKILKEAADLPKSNVLSVRRYNNK